MSEAIDAIARAFVTARREGRPLAQYPGSMPETLTDGYAVQTAAIAMRGGSIAGWKVARVDPPREGADRLAGPVFADLTVASGGRVTIVRDGFAAAEAEIMCRLARAPDPKVRRWTPARAAALIETVHLGIEVAGSPFAGINAHGPAVTISDFGNNLGLVVGSAVTHEAPGQSVTVDVNGERVGEGDVPAIDAGPIAAVCFLLDHLAARGIPIAAGTWISTGALTGGHRVRPGDTVAVRLAGQLAAACSLHAI